MKLTVDQRKRLIEHAGVPSYDDKRAPRTGQTMRYARKGNAREAAQAANAIGVVTSLAAVRVMHGECVGARVAGREKIGEFAFAVVLAGGQKNRPRRVLFATDDVVQAARMADMHATSKGVTVLSLSECRAKKVTPETDPQKLHVRDIKSTARKCTRCGGRNASLQCKPVDMASPEEITRDLDTLHRLKTGRGPRPVTQAVPTSAPLESLVDALFSNIDAEPEIVTLDDAFRFFQRERARRDARR